jgi:hypothetical protein
MLRSTCAPQPSPHLRASSLYPARAHLFLKDPFSAPVMRVRADVHGFASAGGRRSRGPVSQGRAHTSRAPYRFQSRESRGR